MPLNVCNSFFATLTRQYLNQYYELRDVNTIHVDLVSLNQYLLNLNF